MPETYSNPLEAFPQEINESVTGLMLLGHLEDEVEFCGHTFVLRTLKGSEELEAALITKEFQDSFGQVKAHAWAYLALSVVAVDGEEDFCPAIGPSKSAQARAKFNYMTNNWYWPVAEFLYGYYANLVSKQADAIEAVENLSTRSLTTYWTGSDSSTKQANSPDASTDSNPSA